VDFAEKASGCGWALSASGNVLEYQPVRWRVGLAKRLEVIAFEECDGGFEEFSPPTPKRNTTAAD
jgi:hypothetical protein